MDQAGRSMRAILGGSRRHRGGVISPLGLDVAQHQAIATALGRSPSLGVALTFGITCSHRHKVLAVFVKLVLPNSRESGTKPFPVLIGNLHWDIVKLVKRIVIEFGVVALGRMRFRRTHMDQ